MKSLLYGLHDIQAAPHVPPGGWCVDTVALSENPAPTDYTALRADVNWIVRLSWGYGSTGTIPMPSGYQDFANACANYVAKSQGANIWIIGNEANHQNERPHGTYITPAMYAECFAKCRNAIKRGNPNARVVPAPCAPYHASPVSWLDYWRDMLGYIAANGGCDGIAVHAYTRSSNPADIASSAKMGPPLEKTYSGFRTYEDALDAVPMALGNLPVYITEFNELLDGGWDDRNTGVVQAAYENVNEWNSRSDREDRLPIQCLVLYRWPKFDRWYIDGKNGVIDDFRAAVERGYLSPTGANAVNTHIPVVSPGTPAPQPSLPPRGWDERLTQRGVTVETPPIAPGQQFWRVVKARWYNEDEAGGRHHIYIETYNPNGNPMADVPFRVTWPSGETRGRTNLREGFDAANYPMSKSLNEFSVMIRPDIDVPSETLKGIGMGADGNSGIHTSTSVTFRLVRMPQITTGSTPENPDTSLPPPIMQPPVTFFVSVKLGANVRTQPLTGSIVTAIPFGEQVSVTGYDAVRQWAYVRWQGIEGYVLAALLSSQLPSVGTGPTPAQPPQPAPSVDSWQRSLAFIKKWEGDWADNPNDPGGATQKGITIGTYTRWRAAHGQPAPSKDDLRNIPDAIVEQIFREWYWNESKANTLAWPMCLAQMNIAVNAGPGRALQFLADSGGNFLLYNAIALEWYTKIDGWKHFGAAWTRRCADVLREASR